MTGSSVSRHILNPRHPHERSCNHLVMARQIARKASSDESAGFASTRNGVGLKQHYYYKKYI